MRYISEKPDKEGERIAELVLVVMAPLRSDSDSLRQLHYETVSVLRKSGEHWIILYRFKLSAIYTVHFEINSKET